MARFRVPTLGGIRHRAARLTQRVGTPTLAEGALTQHLIESRCVGRGAEIGPGRKRFQTAERTVTFDRFHAFHSGPCDVDVITVGFDLPVPSGTFDYVISSHCLEHVPDTLRNLEEWLRVLKDDGCLFLVLPHRDRTFDRDRPISTLEHHLAEYGVEDDPDHPLHWDEWEQRLSRDQPGWLERPGARLPNGRINPRFAVERGLIHYHCWTQDEMIRVLQYLGCAIDAVLDRMPDRVDSFLIVARKGIREVRLDLIEGSAADDELPRVASMPT